MADQINAPKTSAEIKALYARLNKREDKKSAYKPKDAVDNFIKVAGEQKKLAEEALAGKNVEFNPRSDWFSKAAGKSHYTVKFSRSAIPTDKGVKFFKADTLEEVIEHLDTAIILATYDDAFKKRITDLSDELKAKIEKNKQEKAAKAAAAKN